MRPILLLIILIFSQKALSQISTFPMGKVTPSELSMQTYPADTSAAAVILSDLGSAYISDQAGEGLRFERYVRIKILKPKAIECADFEIGLHKEGFKKEELLEVVASAFNLENGDVKESKLDSKNVFKSDVHELQSEAKFAIPNVRVGTVIEVKYRINSPFFFYNFRSWTFQKDYPLIHSEYHTVIPGNYVYKVALKGELKLTRHKSDVIKNCFGGSQSECVETFYAMDSVPAFVEEAYMTARSNFQSALNFELEQVTYSNGRPQKFTKEWKDVDLELQISPEFGDQMKKARTLFAEQFNSPLSTTADTLAKAHAIYEYFRSTYSDNDIIGIVTYLGVKKAYEGKTGSVADINLSMAGAMQAVKITAYPVILSTRNNGTPTQLYPVMADFNYVILAVKIGGKMYLLDASSKSYPFGLIPPSCLNGKGRIMTKPSSWIDLKAGEKMRTAVNAVIDVTETGYQGTVARVLQGYDAVSERFNFTEAGKPEDYAKVLQKKWNIEVSDYAPRRLDSIDFPYLDKMKIRKDETQGQMIYFNPFIIPVVENSKAFHSLQRSYPVDFGSAFDVVYMLTLTFPPNYEIDETPTPTALTLPNGGGKFLFNVTELGNKVSVTFNLSINRAIFGAGEYASLKEFFARIIQIQQSQIVLKRKA